MSVRRLDLIREERGVTVIELVVATLAGMTVFLGLTMVVVGAMHQTTRVSKRVHATQDARTVLHRIVTELHSACVSADVAPIQQNSSGTSMSFVYQTGSAPSLTPVLRQVTLTGSTLTLTTYNATSGSTPKWTFNSTPASTQTLITGVSAVSGSIPLFRYYKYENGLISTTPLSVPLSAANAAVAVQVNLAVKVSPPGSTVTDAKAAGIVQDSALLRFTPPAYNPAATNPPCE
jgi:Tfp pilus assembly protein PilW